MQIDRQIYNLMASGTNEKEKDPQFSFWAMSRDETQCRNLQRKTGAAISTTYFQTYRAAAVYEG